MPSTPELAGMLAGFDGATLEPARDQARLAHQLLRVKAAIQDGRWRTLGQLVEITGAPEASVSARLRDLRKPRFGGYVIERRFVARGLHEYRLALAPELNLSAP